MIEQSPKRRKYGGRTAGTPNRSTVERALRAARQVAEAKASGRKLAVDVLDECMHLTMGMAAEFQKAAGGPMPLPADWDKFWQCVDAAIESAGKLAKYQSPTMKAVEHRMTVTPVLVPTIEGSAQVISLNDPNVKIRAYQRMLAAPAK